MPERNAMPVCKKYENQYIGCNIRRARLRVGLSEHIAAVAVSRRHRHLTEESLKALEQGAYCPSPMRLYHIARVLKVAMEELLD